mmetsp:Transcript_52708/g.111993  ORF Transcript_52708/g.111993 Transcript_52708/m.111993 type:complete len:94 (+) Transcript_52708:524-805(+)
MEGFSVGVVDDLFIKIKVEALLLAREGPALGVMHAGLVRTLEGTVAFNVGLCNTKELFWTLEGAVPLDFVIKVCLDVGAVDELPIEISTEALL